MEKKKEPLPGLLYEARFGGAPQQQQPAPLPPAIQAVRPEVPPRPEIPPACQQQQQEEEEEYEDDDGTIKLGLGDFVFYSLLCARAALVSFTTFIAVFVVVLFGLATTLVLLAVYRAALPALPISIFLGLAFFFATDAVIVPFVNDFSNLIAFV